MAEIQSTLLKYVFPLLVIPVIRRFIRRDAEGHPIWQKDYEAFMDTVGFSTKLCRPRHPFTKGKVERLVRYVKENFLCARTFGDLTDLNYEAERWCSANSGSSDHAIR